MRGDIIEKLGKSICFFYKNSFINKNSGIFCLNQIDKTVIVTRIKNISHNFKPF